MITSSSIFRFLGPHHCGPHPLRSRSRSGGRSSIYASSTDPEPKKRSPLAKGLKNGSRNVSRYCQSSNEVKDVSVLRHCSLRDYVSLPPRGPRARFPAVFTKTPIVMLDHKHVLHICWRHFIVISAWGTSARGLQEQPATSLGNRGLVRTASIASAKNF